MANVVCQVAKIPKETVSSADQKAIKKFAERFVMRYRQTRSLKPLISEFFVADFDRCLKEAVVKSVDNGKKTALSEAELRRGFIARMNLLYIQMTVFTYDSDHSRNSDYESLASVFPTALAREISSFGFQPDLLDDENLTNRALFLRNLLRAEKAVDQARLHMRRKDLESSVKYRKEVERYAKSDWLGYIVKSISDNNSSFCGATGNIRSMGSPTYSVTTPIWFVLAVVRKNNQFRIQLIGLYDN